MLTIILFGSGWDGDVWDLESYSRVIKAPNLTFRHLESRGGVPVFEDAEFEVFEYQLDDEIYLVGIHGERPDEALVKQAITLGLRRPRPYKTL
ncbi:hypothetical protein ACM26E_08725 [Kluyvera cryocrescens]|uniref:hypothetical protein n=1 Tax=Kluyvera cryocrescens TaxID=580 RepID=UPI0039F4F214